MEQTDKLPTIVELRKDLMKKAVIKSGYNKLKACGLLGISERTFYNWAKRYKLTF